MKSTFQPRLLLAATLFAAAHGAYAATAAGTTISNTATATYLDGLTPRTATSNTVVTTVQQVASLALTAGTTKNAGAGTQVVFAHTITNSGNGADTFNLTAANTGTFTMANVVFYADANGDGVADNNTAITSTGSLGAGNTFSFVAVGTLPSGAANGTSNTITVTATSAFNTGVTATASDITNAAAGSSMDITANTSGLGAGAGAEATAVVTNTVAPGATTRFSVVLNNAGGSPDTFNLQAAVNAAFSPTTLPTGWTVVFKDANGNVITNATVAANSSVQVYADVTIAPGTTLGTTDIYFRALSPTSNVGDIIHDAVIIANTTSLVTLSKTQAIDADCNGVADTAFSNAPITSGAIPGACIRYAITATNSGSTDVGAVSIRDDIPAHTTYHTTNVLAATLGSIVLPITGPVTQVRADVLLLSPGQSSTMTFGVKID